MTPVSLTRSALALACAGLLAGCASLAPSYAAPGRAGAGEPSPTAKAAAVAVATPSPTSPRWTGARCSWTRACST